MKRLKDGRGIVAVSAPTAGVLAGEIDVSEWDDEELLRGQRKNKRGTWTGRPPLVVPAALHKELTSRRFQRSHALLADSLLDAALMLRAIVNDKDASPSDRIRAAEVIFDRVVGKPRESVSLDVHTESVPWQRMMITAIVGTEEQATEMLTGDIVEAELVVEGE